VLLAYGGRTAEHYQQERRSWPHVLTSAPLASLQRWYRRVVPSLTRGDLITKQVDEPFCHLPALTNEQTDWVIEFAMIWARAIVRRSGL
jgi:hypothetical protein